MGELKKVITKQVEVNDDVVRVLKNALKLAESGELTGVVVAGEYRDACAYTHFSASLNRHILISAIEIVKHRLIASLEKVS